MAVPLVAVLASWRHPAWDVWSHLWRTQLSEIITNTLLLVTGVGVGTLVLGAGLAWLIAACHFPGRAVFEWALVLPLALPAYVSAFAFLALFDYAGPLQTTLRRHLGASATLPPLSPGWAVVAVMTLVFYPYVYLLARAAFREHGRSSLEVARSLGCSRRRAFFAVVLPLARPSLAAGVSLAMMEALADFGTVSTFGYRTLTEAVYRVWTGMFDRVAASQLATVLLGSALSLLLLERTLRGGRRFVQGERTTAALPRATLRGWRAAAATAACGVVVGLGFVAPVVQLVLSVSHALFTWRGTTTFIALLGATFVLAAAAAALVGALGLVLAYATRLRPTRATAFATQFASMGYALPGAVVAVGVLGPVAWLDHGLSVLAGWALERRLDVLLTGSVAAVLFAYAVRFLAVGHGAIDSALLRIPSSFDEAARSLGVTIAGTLRRVHLPLLRGGLITAVTLTWVETIKELPATLLLRPLGLKTLAIEVWERTSESMWDEAALPALAIVGVGLVPLLLGTRLIATPPR